jgi:uncharacterized membrane protein
MTERKLNWKKMLFIASLGLNVLVIAALVGSAFKPHSRGGAFKGGTLQGAMVRALPDDQRKALRERMRKNGDYFKAQRGKSRAVKADLKAAIIAVPFDADQLRQVFARQKHVRSDFSNRGDAMWIELIENMSDDERVQFANGIEFRKHRKPRQ